MGNNDHMLFHISLFAPTRFLAHHVDSENQYTMLLFLSGSGQCRLEHPRAFEAGDTVMLCPGYDVDFVCNEANAASVVIIQFPRHNLPGARMQEPLSSWTQQYFNAARPDVWIHLAPRPLADLSALFRTLYTEYCAQHPGSAELSQLLLSALVGWLARLYHLQQPPKTNTARRPRGMEIVEHARRIIALEFTEPLTLESVAKRCFVTPVYLSRLFREKTGLPFNRYLNLARVSHACRLLLDTDELAVDIGEASGFSSTPHFNLTFRKLTGFTPLEYRRRFQRTTDTVAAQDQKSEKSSP